MGLFKSASPPPVSLPPPPPQMPIDAAATNASYRAQTARNAGLASTIVTSPQGTLGGQQTTATKTALGQ